MPEMRFRIRWPDGSTESCYSPSLVIKDYFAAGHDLSAGGLPRAQPHRAHHRERAGARQVRLSLLAARWPARAHRDRRAAISRVSPAPTSASIAFED